MSEATSIFSLLDKPEEPEPESEPSFFDLFDKEGPGPEAEEARPAEPPPTAVQFDPRAFYWTLRNLPLKEATKHMLVCGMIGSGKTTLIRLFLQSIAPRFHPDNEVPEQLIVFDAKGDMVSLLAGLGLAPGMDNFWLLHPADARGARWNIAEAAGNPLAARHVATLLIPEEKQSNAPYFADAARELVFACILALNHRTSRWSFRDLLCSLESVERVRAVTQLFPPAGRVAARIIEDDKHAQGVLSTLGSKLGRFDQVAALWSPEHLPKFSIREFLKRPGVLILSNDARVRESIWPINALLLKALTDEILLQPETQLPRFWFVLDEFGAMQNVPCMKDLLNRGRSKGAAVLLGAQSVEGLVDIYGEQGANSLISQCACKTFLRVGGPITGEWAERYFAKVRSVERTWSESSDAKGHSRSQQFAVKERSLFLSSVFQDLPLPEPGGPLVAISDVPCLHHVCISTQSFDQLLQWCCPAASVPSFAPRDDLQSQWLQPWDEAETKYYCAPPKEQQADQGLKDRSDRPPPRGPDQ